MRCTLADEKLTARTATVPRRLSRSPPCAHHGRRPDPGTRAGPRRADFTTSAPNCLRIGDTSVAPCGKGGLYLAVLRADSVRRVVYHRRRTNRPATHRIATSRTVSGRCGHGRSAQTTASRAGGDSTLLVGD